MCVDGPSAIWPDRGTCYTITKCQKVANILVRIVGGASLFETKDHALHAYTKRRDIQAVGVIVICTYM